MLDSKFKIKKQTLQIYQILDSTQLINSKVAMAEIEDKRQFKQIINIIYAILINYTTPILKKINTLAFLKNIFQTAHPDVILEAQKILPVLADIVMSPELEASGDVDGGWYFVLKEMRPVCEVQLSKKYFRLGKEIIKQWGEYMIDLKLPSSPFVTCLKKCEEHIIFPSYFIYFTMKEYVQFMLNYLKRKKKDESFEQKVKIHSFLTTPNQYSKNLPFYRQNLSQNAGTIAHQTYSILINHSIPIESKLQTLQSMRDLYQQGNILYSMTLEQLIVPYFNYVIGKLQKGLAIQRFFQIVERRFDTDWNLSKQYVNTILSLIKQWDKYNSEKPLNPFEAMSQSISKKQLLNKSTKQIFQKNDINKFMKNSLGKHREPEYVIPVSKSNDETTKLKQQLKEYEQVISKQNEKQKQFKKQIQSLTAELANKKSSSFVKQRVNPSPQQSPQKIKQPEPSQFKSRKMQSPVKENVAQIFQFDSPQINQVVVSFPVSQVKTMRNALQIKQKQIQDKVSNNIKKIKSRKNSVSMYQSANQFNHTSARKSQDVQDLFKLPQSTIKKYSEAIKFRQTQRLT